ncbi:hypothetical protein HanXRQr2_Chr15g0676891 [Helianthus annuus]|uniref:Uncharacterized protein n=1 Tax=Helianthus annuus TaxID=4232 RepID=A0A251S696_HELAN|nr:hypothetical protein HanXRQr2_Chr15g0676891 [Helianthus annuus]KAJ0450057.1 hypothetical protein HanHA300_Chr15g0552211 [Helianthus annuus]KAJ0471835.1 hypothetical protein HanHA89_Chr15g0600451 [Helianthus annuus]
MADTSNKGLGINIVVGDETRGRDKIPHGGRKHHGASKEKTLEKRVAEMEAAMTGLGAQVDGALQRSSSGTKIEKSGNIAVILES